MTDTKSNDIKVALASLRRARTAIDKAARKLALRSNDPSWDLLSRNLASERGRIETFIGLVSDLAPDDDEPDES